MTCVRRLFVGGLYVMAAVGLSAAIWPSVATAAAVAFAVSAGLVGGGALAAAARWTRREVAWRRELRQAAPSARVRVLPVAAPALSQLRPPA